MSDLPHPPHAATVMLVRDAPNGMEVCLVQRTNRTGAFSGLVVFPGGRVDAEDHNEQLVDLPAHELATMMSIDDPAVAVSNVVAVVRECFEEIGVLLARAKQGLQPTATELASARQEMRAGTLTFTRFCEDRNLVILSDLVAFAAHWITPKPEKRRFDTRFFVAAMPPGQTVAHDGEELVSSIWLTPQEALTQSKQGTLKMILPTITNLRELSPLASADDAIAHYRSKDSIPTIMPVVTSDDKGSFRIVLPHESDYQRLKNEQQ